MKNKIHIPSTLTVILDAITKQGGKPYIVGGLVRDALTGFVSSKPDIDVEVYGLAIEQLITVLTTFGSLQNQNQSFGVFSLKELPGVDFTLPRKEIKAGKNHRDFMIAIDPYLSVKEATKRRDFTINALLYEYQTGFILDFYDGLDAMHNQRIHMVNSESFEEDPLRVLRAARFASQLSYQVSDATKHICKQMVKEGGLEQLSSSHIYREYSKLLVTKNPVQGLSFLYDIGALEPTYAWDACQDMIEAASRRQTDDHLAFMFSCLGFCCIQSTPESIYALFGIGNKRIKRYITTMWQAFGTVKRLTLVDTSAVSYMNLLRQIEDILPALDLYNFIQCCRYLMNNDKSIRMMETYMQTKFDSCGTKVEVPYITGALLRDYGFPPSPMYTKILDTAYKLQMQGQSKDQIMQEIRRKYKNHGERCTYYKGS